MTTPNDETVDYTYSPADDLLTMEDDRDKTTTWTYDDEGRVASKEYEGDNFEHAKYAYDVTGNLRPHLSTGLALRLVNPSRSQP